MSDNGHSPEATKLIELTNELTVAVGNLIEGRSDIVGKDRVNFARLKAFCILHNVGVIEHATCFEIFKVPENANAEWMIETANCMVEQVDFVAVAKATAKFEDKMKEFIEDYLKISIAEINKYYGESNAADLQKAGVIPHTYLQRRMLNSIRANKAIKASGQDALSVFNSICDKLCEDGFVSRLNLGDASQFNSTAKLYGYIGEQ